MIHLRKKKKEEHTPKVKKKTGIIQSILNPIGFAKKAVRCRSGHDKCCNYYIVYGYVIVSNADDFALAYVTHDAVARGTSKDSILCSSRRNA